MKNLNVTFSLFSSLLGSSFVPDSNYYEPIRSKFGILLAFQIRVYGPQYYM